MRLIEGDLAVKDNWKIGVVVSRFNQEVTQKLEAGAVSRLAELGVNDANMLVTRVPGAMELPLAAQKLLESGCDMAVALGVVIRGETSHYESVCQACERGCSELQLRYTKPVAFGVLMTEDKEQALARAGGPKGHKGVEAAEVAVEMKNLMMKITI